MIALRFGETCRDCHARFAVIPNAVNLSVFTNHRFAVIGEPAEVVAIFRRLQRINRLVRRESIVTVNCGIVVNNIDILCVRWRCGVVVATKRQRNFFCLPNCIESVAIFLACRPNGIARAVSINEAIVFSCCVLVGGPAKEVITESLDNQSAVADCRSARIWIGFSRSCGVNIGCAVGHIDNSAVWKSCGVILCALRVVKVKFNAHGVWRPLCIQGDIAKSARWERFLSDNFALLPRERVALIARILSHFPAHKGVTSFCHFLHWDGFGDSVVCRCCFGAVNIGDCEFFGGCGCSKRHIAHAHNDILAVRGCRECGRFCATCHVPLNELISVHNNRRDCLGCANVSFNHFVWRNAGNACAFIYRQGHFVTCKVELKVG